MNTQEPVYLSLGTNLGERVQNLAQARQFIALIVGPIRQVSPIYETAAWGIEAQASFLNQVLEVETNLSPTALLEAILGIEQKMGRIRKVKWGERLIDIDILFYGDLVIDEERLKIPHPYIPVRNFVLAPLAAIAPNFVHPILKMTMAQLLEASTDSLSAEVISE